MTPIKPAPILVTLLFGLAGLSELLVLDDDEPVPVLSEPPVPVGLEVAYVEPKSVSPIVGSATFPLTSHALVPVLLDGQVLVDRLPVSMLEDMMPVGVSVAHCVLRFEKSGETGVGVL